MHLAPPPLNSPMAMLFYINIGHFRTYYSVTQVNHTLVVILVYLTSTQEVLEQTTFYSVTQVNHVPVVIRGSVCILSAGPLDAGVPAGVVAELAVLDVAAVVVLHALKDRSTHA